MRGEARLRQDMEDDRRFRLGRLGDESFQWPDRIYQARQQEKRPCLQTNRMPAFVALALNAVIGANLRPSVQPVDDKADVKTAEVLSALIRNTEHISQVEAVYAAAIDSMAENGRGYVQINMNILKSLMRSPLGLDGASGESTLRIVEQYAHAPPVAEHAEQDADVPEMVRRAVEIGQRARVDPHHRGGVRLGQRL